MQQIAFAALAVTATILAGCDNMMCTPHGGQKAVQRAILDQLKAPVSAKFSDMSLVSGPGPDEYMVSGKVDAQNSYGALIRNSFIGRATCTPSNAKYTVVSATLF